MDLQLAEANLRKHFQAVREKNDRVLQFDDDSNDKELNSSDLTHEYFALKAKLVSELVLTTEGNTCTYFCMGRFDERGTRRDTIGEQAFRELTKAFLHPNCKVYSLSMFGIDLSSNERLVLKELLQDRMTSFSYGSKGFVVLDDFAEVFCDILKSPNNRLRHLTLPVFGNVEMFRSFAKAMVHENCRLEELTLENALRFQIDGRGGGYNKKPNSARLTVNGEGSDPETLKNAVREEGAIAFIETCFEHYGSSIRCFNVFHMDVNEPSMEKICRIITGKDGSNINDLTLHHVNPGETAVARLAAALRHKDCKIRTFSFIHNGVPSNALLDAVKFSTVTFFTTDPSNKPWSTSDKARLEQAESLQKRFRSQWFQKTVRLLAYVTFTRFTEANPALKFLGRDTVRTLMLDYCSLRYVVRTVERGYGCSRNWFTYQEEEEQEVT